MPIGQTPRMSVLLPVRDGEGTLAEQLTALASQHVEGGWELVVADNGSRDGTLRVIERHRHLLPRLVVVDAAARPGRSVALETAAAAASGDSLAFVDHDDVVGAGWLAATAAALDRWDLVGCRLEHRLLNPAWTLAHRGEPQSDGLPRLPGAAWAHSWGCALAVRRSWHERVGGFDSDYDGAEDIDYCWRLQEAGARLGFAADAVVHYRHRTGLRDLHRQSRTYARQTARVLAGHGSGAGPGPARELRAWAGLVKRMPVVPDRRRLGIFLWNLGERLGTLDARRAVDAPAGTSPRR